MNPRNTWLLVILAVGLFAFIWLIEPRLRPAPPAKPRVMPVFKPAEVTSVQIQPKNQPVIRVERTNGIWLMTKPLVYPVKAGVVDNFLQSLGELSPRNRISAEELRQHHNVSEEYGFDAPLATIILEFGGEPHTLNVGNRTALGDELYTQLVGMDSVDVIGADFLRFIPSRSGDWRDTTFFSVADSDFDRLTVSNASRTLELARDGAGRLWRLTKPVAARADNTKLGILFNNLRSLRVNTFVTDDPGADLERFGLQPPQLELTFGEGTNRLFSLQFGKSPANDNNLIYARSNAQGSVVLLPRDLVARWWDTNDDFRERHLLDVAANPPDEIDVSAEDGDFTLLLTNGVWLVFDAQKQGYRADVTLVREFLRNLALLQVAVQPGGFNFQDVASEPYLKDYHLAPKPFRSYVLKRNYAPATTNELDFGIVTNGYRLARRADETNVVAVQTNDFDGLYFRVIQLRDRRVWYFEANDVVNLTFRNNRTNQVWERKGTNDWDLASPGIMRDPGQASVGLEEVAKNLGALEIQTWDERGDQNRAKYGITEDKPRIAVDVRQGGASKTFALELGNQDLDARPPGFYACVPVQEGQTWTNWIVTISLDDLENFDNWLPKSKQ